MLKTEDSDNLIVSSVDEIEVAIISNFIKVYEEIDKNNKYRLR